jgi:hypothetical protein
MYILISWYLIYCKNFYKCHNVHPAQKKKKKKDAPKLLEDEYVIEQQPKDPECLDMFILTYEREVGLFLSLIFKIIASCSIKISQ